MDWNAILAIALPAVFVVVGIALIWFLIELIATVRTTRKTVTSIKNEIEPTLAHVESITAQVDPLVAKVEPLVDRVSLTVDAANLEVMRLDQILENVTDITDGLSSATAAIDAATNAPVNLVNKTSEKVRNAFKPHKASQESAALGAGKTKSKAAGDAALPSGKDTTTGAQQKIAEPQSDTSENIKSESKSSKDSFDFLDNMSFKFTSDTECSDAQNAPDGVDAQNAPDGIDAQNAPDGTASDSNALQENMQVSSASHEDNSKDNTLRFVISEEDLKPAQSVEKAAENVTEDTVESAAEETVKEAAEAAEETTKEAAGNAEDAGTARLNNKGYFTY